VGYAVCALPVRIWRERPFDPDAASVRQECVNWLSATGGGDA
jgi:hypothetical protein